MTTDNGGNRLIPTPSRRTIVTTGLGAAIAAPAILKVIPVNAQSRVIKIGHVSPRTGPLAAFGEADPFVLDNIGKLTAKGIQAAGRTYPVQIISKDSQSSASRAAEVAAELILRDKVDLIVGASTPDTTNPVADQAEVNEVPCITTDCPWQPYFFGRKGDPKKGFNWTYHFFWGLEDLLGSFTALWDQAATNKVVGGMFSNDADGNAFADKERGFPPALAAAGYKLSSSFQLLSNDFTAQIDAFKKANVEIVTGVFIPPDFATFWSQCAQQGLRLCGRCQTRGSGTIGNIPGIPRVDTRQARLCWRRWPYRTGGRAWTTRSSHGTITNPRQTSKGTRSASRRRGRSFSTVIGSRMTTVIRASAKIGSSPLVKSSTPCILLSSRSSTMVE